MVIEVNTGESASGYMELETTGDKRGEGFRAGNVCPLSYQVRWGLKETRRVLIERKLPPFSGPQCPCSDRDSQVTGTEARPLSAEAWMGGW